MSDVVTYFMPVETTARELDYKLVLAALLQAPHRQFLFFRPDLAEALLRLTRGGVWVGQNIRTRTPRGDDYTRYHRLKKAGFAVVYIDEEGGVYPGDEARWTELIRGRLDPTVLSSEDVLVAWGGFQADVWRAGPARLRAQVTEQGHPRFDLYRAPYASLYGARAEALQRAMGEFVLINTNFASANFVTGLGGLFNRRDGYVPEDTALRLEFVAGWQRALTSLGEFVAMTHRLAAQHPHTTFVVRPHPVEDHGVYRAVLSNVPNVRVEHDGSVVPWLMAATAVIHNGCTTALEAFLCGTPVIAYCPPSIGDGESWLPNLFSARAESPAELDRLVGAVLEGRLPEVRPDTEKRARVAGMIAQLGERETASRAFDAVVAAAQGAESALRPGTSSFQERRSRLVAEAHGAGARAKRALRRVRHWTGSPQPAPPKFQPFTNEMMADRIKAVAAAIPRSLSVQVFSDTACLVH